MSKKWNLQDIRPIERSSAPRPVTQESRPERPRPIQKMPAERPMLRPKRPTHQTDEHYEEEPEDFHTLPTIEVTDNKRKGKRLLLVAVAVFFVSIVSAYSIGTLTGGAEITIYPKVRSMNVNAEFTAYKDKRPGELSYEILTLEATGERQVQATGQEEVSIQTVGEIEIFKTTPGTERLIKNTRFETADGKIFRIQESIVIPGAVRDSAGTLRPGSIRAEVFADQAGEAYNIPANTRLTVPGFRDSNLTELYNAVYATNATDFTGGFDGPRFIINETELATAKQALQLELRDTLRARINAERPANYTLFEDSIAITYTSLPPVQYGDTLVTVREKALLQIPLFNQADFASFIAKETIVGYDVNEQVRIDNLPTMSFAYSSATTSATIIANLDELTFKIVGQPVIVWTYDEAALKESLVGKEKTALPLALGQYSQESRSTLKIRPFWQSKFPDDKAKIIVTEVLEVQ